MTGEIQHLEASRKRRRGGGDPSKRGSFDLKSLSDVAGYGIRQRSFAPVEVPVFRGKGSWRRPFSPFLEFYLSGVGYLRLRRGIRGTGAIIPARVR